MDHPPTDVLMRFLWVRASREENRRVVRHLLARCPVCAGVLKRLKPEPPGTPADYDEALDRFAARVRELGGASGGVPLAPTRTSSGAFPKRASG